MRVLLFMVMMTRPLSKFWALMICPVSHSAAVAITPLISIGRDISCPLQSDELKRA